ITLDTPHDEAIQDDYTKLWTNGVRSALEDAAIYVGAWLKPTSG
ncbi:MAG: hypothetical protein JWM47_1232, partial [Acidimicrobiales bacterium]|nr:hypothetical protein [Acidimicrobiales bacterium]